MDWQTIFPSWPNEIRENIEKAYNEIRQRYFESNFEPSELNGGKFCESVYRLLEWQINRDNSFTPFGTPLRNFRGSIRSLCENKSDQNYSIRFHIPSALVSMFYIRNERGVGHTGGDVNPNRMDSEYVLAVSSWVMAELVRIYHDVSLKEAQAIVEELVETKIPIVWVIGERRRVLIPRLPTKDKILLVLLQIHPNSISSNELMKDVEYSNITNFRNKVLRGLHREKLIEFNEKANEINLSPTGIQKAEEIIKENRH